MQNFDFVPKVCETATEKARREREQRELLRRGNAAANRIQAFVRGRKVVAIEQQHKRDHFDEVMSSLFPHDEDKLAIRTGTFNGTLPLATKVFDLVRLLNFFFHSSNCGDCKRIELLSSLIAAGVSSTTAAQNYCFLSIPTLGDTMAAQWALQTDRLLTRLFGFVDKSSQAAKDERGCKQVRTTAALLLRLVICLTDWKQWGFIRMRGKRREEMTPQEEELLVFLSQKSSEACATLLQRSQSAMYVALRSLILACTVPEPVPPQREDVVVAAAFTLVINPVISAPPAGPDPSQTSSSATASCRRAFGQSIAPHSPLPCLLGFLDIPFLCQRASPSVLQLLHHRTMWERLIPHLVSTTSPATADWSARYVFGNVVQIGMTALAPLMASSSPQDGTLCAQWFKCLRRLLCCLPPTSVVRKSLEAEGALETQVSELWATPTVKVLFAELFEEVDGTGEEMNAQPPTMGQCQAATKDWKDMVKGPKWPAFLKKMVKPSPPPSSISDSSNVPAAAFTIPRWVTACQLYDQLLSAWPSRPPLAALCFRRPYLVVALWRWLWAEGHRPTVEEYMEGTTALPPATEVALTAVFTLFCRLYHNFLLITDGEEFHKAQNPFRLTTVVHIAHALNRLAFRLLASTETIRHGASVEDQQRWFALRDEAYATVQQLVDRDTRQAFVPNGRWVLHGTPLWQRLLARINLKVLKDDALAQLLDSVNDFSNVASHLPHTIPFDLRVKLFRQKVDAERRRYCVEDRKWQITIRRQHIVEDGFRAFSAASSPARLKAKMFVMFQNEHGLPEAGIDAGGVFKEFVTHCLRQVFDPSFGLFTTTADDHVYPNPASGKLHPDHLQLFQFIGRVAAKALFEGIVANVPLADFFFNFLLQKPNSVDDLASQDPELFRNLMYLKSPECDLEAMSLTFCVEEELLGQHFKWELQPRGAEVDVTEDNLIFYIHAMADYKLNQRIASQTRAFLMGYFEVINPEWLRMFDRRELCHLISGEARDFDVEDLRQYTQYAGGYDANHRVIKAFWAVLREMNAEQRSRFLQFVTSCPKPPLLGFANLHPPMCIRCCDQADAPTTSGGALRALGLKDTDRLPSSSTCFNLLKLPPYRTQKQLREKLLYAINAGSGFELS